MGKFDFGGVMEEVITEDEFPLHRAREVLQNEVVAVVGYGVQGPGQALNMRDNGIRVIVGQRQCGKSWEGALSDGFVPGETLFPPEEAAQRATIIQYLLSDAGQVAMWPQIKPCLKPGDTLYFSHGFGIVYKDQTGIIPPARAEPETGNPTFHHDTTDESRRQPTATGQAEGGIGARPWMRPAIRPNGRAAAPTSVDSTEVGRREWKTDPPCGRLSP